MFSDVTCNATVTWPANKPRYKQLLIFPSDVVSQS